MSAPVDTATVVELTAIELAILHALAAGARRNDIAAQLDITHATVNNRLDRLYSKLGVRCAVRAVIIAERAGLLDYQSVTDCMS